MDPMHPRPFLTSRLVGRHPHAQRIGRKGEFPERHSNFPLEPTRICLDFDAFHDLSRGP